LEELVKIILSKSRFKAVSKNTILLQEGSICDRITYLKNGITRHFLLDAEGNDITKNFSVGPSFVAYSISSFLSQTESQIQFEALSNLEIYELSYNDYLELKNNPDFVILWNDLLSNYIYKKEKKEISLLKDNASKRYLDFLQDFPGLMNKIPQYYIASYLSITPESLSRIRKKLT